NLAWPRSLVYDLTGHTWWLQWSAVLFIGATLIIGFGIHLRLRGSAMSSPAEAGVGAAQTEATSQASAAFASTGCANTASASTAQSAPRTKESPAMATVADQHETGTVHSARADARAQGGKVADAMPYVPASSTPYPPPGVDVATLTWAETVAGGNYAHKVL